METTEPLTRLVKGTEIAQSSLKAAVDRAAQQLGVPDVIDGGRVRLVGIKDAGVVGAQVELTFAKELENGTLAIGAFGEFTAKGDRRAGGVISWEWGS